MAKNLCYSYLGTYQEHLKEYFITFQLISKLLFLKTLEETPFLAKRNSDKCSNE